jgi:hypothetical protein
MTIVTKASMIEVLNNKSEEFISQYIGRALVALFRRQIESERLDNTSKVTNYLGFSKPDATDGCIGAKYFIKHGKLEDWQVAKWLVDFRGNPRIVKYSAQLNEIALEKKSN